MHKPGRARSSPSIPKGLYPLARGRRAVPALGRPRVQSPAPTGLWQPTSSGERNPAGVVRCFPHLARVGAFLVALGVEPESRLDSPGATTR